MIVLVYVSIKESKNAAIKKKTSSEKFNTLKGEPYLNNPVEIMNIVKPNPSGNKYDLASVLTSSIPQAEHPIGSVVDAPIFDVFLNNILDGNKDSDSSKDQTVENDQNEEHEAQGEKNVKVEVLSKKSDGNNEVSGEDSHGGKDNGQKDRNFEINENNNIHIVHIMKSLIKRVTRPQDKETQVKVKEVVDVEEENKTNEELAMKIMSRTLSDELKEKKKRELLNREKSKRLPLKDNLLRRSL
ncbi:unnamed protein product [Vicia faba]|uniref:Uncharacterized protein n=1 Tax=Vicia faba TaxID=3906 RepID=A0AAV0ZYC2_VICFA|nr:unnamed protein product [Vicia faba]